MPAAITPQNTQSIKKTGAFTAELSGNSAAIFPLLCPTREYDWIPGWQCTLLYSESGFAEELCVFTKINDIGSKETWICTRYEPNKAIQYTRFSEEMLGRLDITLLSEQSNNSRWHWQETLISLNEAGYTFLLNHTQEQSQTKFERINLLLEYYIKHGRMNE